MVVRERGFWGVLHAPAVAVLRCLIVSLALITVSASAALAANNRYAAIVIDAKTGKTLFSRNADAARYPASLTKMMTLYILFEEMERGRFTLKSRLKVSKYAASRPPSKLGLKPGQTITVENAIRALAVKSANDVASVVAEAVEGTEARFAKRMTRTARALKMSRTTFRNPSGLPNSRQKTTARDMARLGLALQDRFPNRYKYFSTRTFSYGKRNYRNTNRLLGVVEGIDGIKTGYTRASGFNLVTSVRRDDRHIIAVVMGGRTGKSRNAHMAELIKKHIRHAKPGKRRTPLLVAAIPLTPPPLPRGRPFIRQDKPQLAMAMVAVPKKRAPSDDPLSELIAAQMEATGEMPQRVNVSPKRYASAGMASGETGVHEQVARPAASDNPVQARTKAGKDDWYVQIAAVPTREGAARLLQQAKLKAGRVLASAEPVTVPVEKSGTTLYRARFAGFSGKNEARAVCARLKRKSVDCLAVPN